jgi:hypothetical protein
MFIIMMPVTLVSNDDYPRGLRSGRGAEIIPVKYSCARTQLLALACGHGS